jgi:hypothetical protein
VPRDTRDAHLPPRYPRHPAPWFGKDAAGLIARLLGNRKGVVIEGFGIIASGAVTVEQAYINYTSIFHATLVKYLEDLLREGFRFPGEKEALAGFREKWLRPLTADGLAFRKDPLLTPSDILAEIETVGRSVGGHWLFFNNISARPGVIYLRPRQASAELAAHRPV